MGLFAQVFRLSLYDETKIASALSVVAEESCNLGVSVGSYPVRGTGTDKSDLIKKHLFGSSQS
jgi:hypothetical protein